MKNAIYLILVTLFSLSFAEKLELNEGDFFSLEITYKKDEEHDKKHYYGLVCQDKQLILDGLVCQFEIKDSTFVLYPYQGIVRLIDGDVQRGSRDRLLELPLPGIALELDGGVIESSFQIDKKNIPDSLNRFQGYWASSDDLTDGFYVANDKIYSKDLDSGLTAEIVSATESDSVEILFTHTTGESEIIKKKFRAMEDEVRLTPTNLNRYLNSAMPFQATASVDTLFAMEKSMESDTSEYLAMLIIKQFHTNNYFVIDETSIELLRIYYYDRSESTIENLEEYLKVITPEKMVKRKKAIRSGTRILKNLKVLIPEGSGRESGKLILTHYLYDSSRLDTPEKKRLFTLLLKAIVRL